MFKSKILYWKTLKPNLVAFFLLIEMVFSFISEIWASLKLSGNRDAMSSLPCPVMRARNILGCSKIWNQSERAKNTKEKKNTKKTLKTLKKATKFGLGFFQGKILFLNIILRLNFTRSWNCNANTKQFCLRISKCGIKIQRLPVIFYFTHSLHPRLGEYPGLFTSTSVNNCSISLTSAVSQINELSLLK